MSLQKINIKGTFCYFFFADEDKWKTEARTEGGAIQEYTISYQNLVPATSYTFRVIAYNKYGISYPAKSQSSVRYVHLSASYVFWRYKKKYFLVPTTISIKITRRAFNMEICKWHEIKGPLFLRRARPWTIFWKGRTRCWPLMLC